MDVSTAVRTEDWAPGIISCLPLWNQAFFGFTNVQLVRRPGPLNVRTGHEDAKKGYRLLAYRKPSSTLFDVGFEQSKCRPAWPSPIPPIVSLFARQMSTSRKPAESSAGIRNTKRQTASGGTIATISVESPLKMNIVNTILLDQLVESCQGLSNDDSLRAVILTGGKTASGKAPSFIGGADIKEMNTLSSSQGAKAFITRVHAACQALRELPVPVIARVRGLSLGAGLEIMASCDLRIATQDSTFGMPEVKVGIPSVVEAALLPGLIGMGRTRRILYLGENISAKEALEWGLVEKIVKDEIALDLAVDEWANVIAGMGPRSIRIQKVLMQSWENGTVEEGIQTGLEAFAEAYRDGGKEPKEFMAKFIDRKR